MQVPLAVCGGEEAVTLLLPLLKIPRADRALFPSDPTIQHFCAEGTAYLLHLRDFESRPQCFEK